MSHVDRASFADTYRSLVVELRQLLVHSPLQHTFWAPYEEAAIWILYFGAHATIAFQQQEWFVAQLACGARLLKLKTWEEVRLLLMRFSYLDRVHHDPFRDIWGKVVVHMEEEEPERWGRHLDIVGSIFMSHRTSYDLITSVSALRLQSNRGFEWPSRSLGGLSQLRLTKMPAML